MTIHYEELWEKCEGLQKEAGQHIAVQQMMDELLIKINLYKAVDSKVDIIPIEEANKIKSRLLGEILLVITGLSVKDNINVYEALYSAFQYRYLENLTIK